MIFVPFRDGMSFELHAAVNRPFRLESNERFQAAMAIQFDGPTDVPRLNATP